MIIIAIIVVICMVLLMGYIFLFRNYPRVTVAMILVMVGLLAWSVHYLIQLKAMPTLTDDKVWHVRYMIAIIFLIPITILGAGLAGFCMHKESVNDDSGDDGDRG